MPEDRDEQASEPLDIGRYVDVVRRRHIAFLIAFFLGWLAVWGASWILPARYKSSTLILVDQPAMPKDYVVPNVSDTLQDRLQSITEQILSRTRLQTIIEKYHLYRGEDSNANMEDRVNRMRKDIGIELVRDSHSASIIRAFRVSYTAQDPHLAQQVTGEMTNLFIDENLKARQKQSRETTQFLESQLARARSNLADQDAKIHAFRAAHEGNLPSQQGINLQILGGLQSQLQTEQGALNTAKRQRVFHESAIDQHRAAQRMPRTVGGTLTGLPAIEQQLDVLKSKLAELSARYTDRYPEVQAVKAEIAKAENRREQLIAGMKANAEEDVQLLNLQRQLQADEREISNREAAINRLQGRINEYQGRLRAEPAVEQQLEDLTRQYEQSRTIYNDLLKKESDSQMATSMEQTQEGGRFTRIDPPSFPQRPDFPNRLEMCAVGLAAGLMLGIAVIAGFEFFDDRLHSNKEIRKLLPIAVISEIPAITSPHDERKRKRKMVLSWAVTALIFVAVAGGSAFSYLHG